MKGWLQARCWAICKKHTQYTFGAIPVIRSLYFSVILEWLAAGKVFGLHSGDGHVLWSRGFGADRRPMHLAHWRTSHDAAAAPEVLLLGSVPSAGRAFFVTLNAHTGAETGSGELPFEVAQVGLAAPLLLPREWLKLWGIPEVWPKRKKGMLNHCDYSTRLYCQKARCF